MEAIISNFPSTVFFFLGLLFPEAVVQRCSEGEGPLKNFTKFIGKHLCQSLFFSKVAAQSFSYQFCEIFKNTFSTEHLPTTVSTFCKT